MAQITNCDRARFQALDGFVYGAIVSPDNIADVMFSGVNSWLAIGGELTGQILTTAEILVSYPGYNEQCQPVDNGVFDFEFSSNFE